MEMQYLCQEIGIPHSVRLRLEAAAPALDSDEISRLTAGLTEPEKAAGAYHALEALLGDDDMAMLVCQLQAAAMVHDRYRAGGIPERIYFDTMACFARFLEETYRMVGQYRFDRGFWAYRQTSMSLFRVGQLEYELRRDQNAVALHIPSDAVFTGPAVDESLKQAEDFLKAYYPDWVDCPMVCSSWLLSPELQGLLGENSNILHFQRRFRITQVKPEDCSFIRWVFVSPEDTTPRNLPENTSLQRKIKQHLLRGGRIGAAAGVMI